jgi:hypothetical protein
MKKVKCTSKKRDIKYNIQVRKERESEIFYSNWREKAKHTNGNEEIWGT